MTYPVLDGKVAIVIGAAMGMGKATAKLFAMAKAKVVVADYNEEKGLKTAEEIKANGGQATFFKVDVSKSEEVQAMVEFTVVTYGKLDVAVNNTTLTLDKHLANEFGEEYWDRLMSIDLKGVSLCQKYELQQMKKQGQGGSIINISSVNAFGPKNISYVAAKHSVVRITKVAALENNQYNIRVNSVASGAINTPMLRGALEQFSLEEKTYTPQRSLLNRFRKPEKVANASLWLASDQSSHITGTTLHIDASYSSRQTLKSSTFD